MTAWLQQLPPERVVMWVFLAGVAWSQLRQARTSLREHGRRLGALAARVTRIETHLQIPPPAISADGQGGDGA
jgi:hypothetical protein